MKRVLSLGIIMILVLFALCGCVDFGTDNDVMEEELLTDVVTAETETETATESYMTRYYNIARNYKDIYGEMIPRDEVGYPKGMCLLDLIDFDSNGTEELVIVCRNLSEGVRYDTYIWTFDGQDVVEVDNADIVSNHGTSVQPVIVLCHKDSKVYSVDEGMTVGETVGIRKTFSTLNGNAMIQEVAFEYSIGNNQVIYDGVVDGTAMEDAEFEKVYTPWTEDGGAVMDTYVLDDGDEFISELEAVTDNAWSRLENAGE